MRGPAGPTRVTLRLHGELSTDEVCKQPRNVIDRIKRGEEPGHAPPKLELTEVGLAERHSCTRVHSWRSRQTPNQDDEYSCLSIGTTIDAKAEPIRGRFGA